MTGPAYLSIRRSCMGVWLRETFFFFFFLLFLDDRYIRLSSKENFILFFFLLLGLYYITLDPRRTHTVHLLLLIFINIATGDGIIEFCLCILIDSERGTS